MKKMKLITSGVFLMFFILAISCSDESGTTTQVETDNDNDGYPATVDCNDNDATINPGATEIQDGKDNNCDGTVDEGFTSATVNTYSGSATYGDLVTFSINKDDETYELYNETTDATETGDYSILDQDLAGLYVVEAGGEVFFGMELDDKIVTANFPSGNSSNTLSFGVSSEIDNSGNLGEIAGDYVYIRLGDVVVNGSADYKEWGVFTLEEGGDIYMIDYATGGTGDYDVLGVDEWSAAGYSFPIDGSEDYYIYGQWSLSGTNADRFDVTLETGSATGYAYAAGNTAVFLLDLGAGNGSAIAFKVTDSTPSDIVDTYKFISVDSDGTKGAGAYTIAADGTITYALTNDAVNVETGSFGPIEQVDGSNIYVGDVDGDYITLVVAGDAIMHFITDADGKLISYGAGAKL